MDCKRARAIFNEHIDGALAEPERAALEAHLRECPVCGDELRGLAGVHAALRTLPRLKAPEGFAGRVMARIEEEPLPYEGGLFGWLSALPFHLKVAEAAAAAAVAVLGIYSAGLLSGAYNGNGSVVAEGEEVIMASASLEYLDPMPPQSLGEVYLSAKENGDE